MSSKTWGRFIDKLDSEHFIGRNKEISYFLNDISRSQPRFLIYFVSGQGGVGKTELLKQYKGITENDNWIIADCNEQQGDIPSILYRFTRQIGDRGYELNNFLGKYKRFQQARLEIESDPSAPLGLAAFIGQSIAKVSLSLAEEVPGLRQGLKLIDQDSISTQAGEWTKYLAQKMSNKSVELALIKDPVFVLSSLFFKDLNEIAREHKILLCFDNYEISRGYLDSWIKSLREHEPSLNIRLAIASRTGPGTVWEDLNNVTLHILLDRFSTKEAQEFLNLAGIANKQRRAEIIEFSGRLPILMSWLASPNSEDPDPALPTASIVDRFLRWVEDPELRAIAVEASIPRFFNIDLLTVLFNERNVSEIEKIFEWLRKQPFISQGEQGWQYHEVVLRHMLSYQNQRSDDRYKVIHNRVANYYLRKLDELNLKSHEQWKNRRAQEYIIEYIYHCLMEAPSANWPRFVNAFVYALKYRLNFAKQIVETLNQPAILQNLDQQYRKTILLFRDELRIISRGVRWDGIKLYDFLGKLNYLEPEALAHVMYLRGEATRIKKQDYANALNFLNRAIELDSSYYQAFAERGELFSNQRKYNKAIIEFDRALKISPSYHWAHERKGFALYYLKRFGDAIKVLDKAEATNKRCTGTLAYRGASHLAIGNGKSAIEDLNRAIEIEPQNGWARIRRGEAYLAIKAYELALADFQSILAEFPGARHECLKNIGLVFAAQEKYSDASTKFIESLLESPNCTHCWKALIGTYENMFSRDEVPGLFTDSKFPAMKFDEEVYLCRAASLAQKGYKEAISDVKKAMGLKPNLIVPSWVGLNDLGLKLAWSEQYSDAIECFDYASEVPDYVKNYNTAVALALWKGIDAAADQIGVTVKILKDLPSKDVELKGISLYGLAGIEAIKNNKTVALSLLQQAISTDSIVVTFAKDSDPAWKSMRIDPEFQKVISSPGNV